MRACLIGVVCFAIGCAEPGAEPCSPESCPEPDTVCVDDEDGIGRCECREGTLPEDDRCVEPTRCEPITCHGRGSCSEEGGAVVCACEPGFAGPLCERCAEGFHDDGEGGCSDDPCNPNPCGADRMCRAVSGEPECECPPGRHDEDGVCVEDTSCLPTTCSGHGVCTEDEMLLSCACDEGWGGAQCHRCDEERGFHDDGEGGCTTDVCVPSPCTEPNRSVCRADTLGVVCECDAGFHLDASACIADETCTTERCSEHGACSILDGRTACACDEGHTGNDCSACDEGWHDDGDGGCTTDVCMPSPCTMPNRSICTEGPSGATCACDPGFHDDGVGGCTNDPCVPNPCAALGMACRGDGECFTPVCDDGNTCTTDTVVGAGCSFTARPNGSACAPTLCTRSQTCMAGVCGGGTAVSCDDGNACTRDRCEALTGCAYDVDETIVPDDGLACTIDACTGGIARHTPSNAVCDDGRWCTGAETCAPGAMADARGCVSRNVPVPPGPNTACSTYACDDARMSFSLVPRSAGTVCDDSIACTSGDACDGTGACRGTVASDCGSVASCTGAPWTGTIDVAPARLIGRVLYAGGTSFPPTAASSAGIGIYLRSQATGIDHLIERVSFGTGGSVVSNSDEDDRVIDFPVLPGVYDVVYRRWSYASSDGSQIWSHYTTDNYAHANQVLRRGVVIGPGANMIDVDVAPVRISGAIQYAGTSTFPTTDASSAGIGIYLRSQATGIVHLIERVSFGTGGAVVSSSDEDDRVIDFPVLAGTYDVVYRRWSYASSDGSQIWSHYTTDDYAHANHVLRRDVVIGPGSTSLNVDVAPVRISGAIQYAGTSTFPTTDASSAGIGIYLRSQATGIDHLIERVSFGTGGAAVSSSDEDDRIIDFPMLPGTYDVVYRRWSYASSDGSQIWSHYTTDDYAHANQVLRRNVVIGPGSTSLNVDVAPVRISGVIQYAGTSTFPTTDASSAGISIYLRSQATGIVHLIERVSFGTGGAVVSSSDEDDRVIDFPVLAGTYDVVYRRWSYASSDGSQIWSHYTTDDYAHANQVLRRDVVIGPGSTSLNVDVAPVRVSGTIQYAGTSTFPTTDASSAGISIYLRSHDTGIDHLIERVSFGTGGAAVSSSDEDDRTIDFPVLPGTYDVVYRRWSYASSDGSQIWSHYTTDDYAHANQVLRRDVVIGPGSTSLTVDVAPARIAGAIQYRGASSFPTTEASSAGISVYLRSRDTGIDHLIERVAFGTGGAAVSSSDEDDRTIDFPVLPGTYDVVYRRWSYASSDGSQIWSHYTTDNYAHANHMLGMCLEIER